MEIASSMLDSDEQYKSELTSASHARVLVTKAKGRISFPRVRMNVPGIYTVGLVVGAGCLFALQKRGKLVAKTRNVLPD